MEFGFTIPKNTDGEGLCRFARAVEDLGFGSVWAADHIVLPSEETDRYPYTEDGRFTAQADDPQLDVFVTLSYIASATSKINVSGPEARVVIDKGEEGIGRSITFSVPQYSADGQKLDTYIRAFGKDSRTGSLTLSFNEKYDKTFKISGLVVVTNEDGNSDFKKFETQLKVKGSCSSHESLDCF